MPSPITSADFDVPNPSADVCDQIVSLISISGKLKTLLEYLFKNNGELTDEFKALLASAVMPVGNIVFRPVASIPLGFVEANGQSLDRTTYAALFSVYGTQFGSDGATTFKVPDAQNLYLAGRGDNAAGTIFGEFEHLLTIAELPAHSHPITPSQLEDSGSGDIPGTSIFGGTSPTGPSGGTLEIQDTGGSTAFPMKPKALAGLWLIKT